ncbi:hypothetical protein BKA67DRAFT_81618 [Truncatella angustata]|uniref:Uncharacterized protein n=1 Tax=Truncatella angustata TaxID=152316 RepID=A0A9P8V026_9PEZI|nr:uncharacterized protein BKA67DRAFT_81618 [Truncatella angustata]KAH6661313.1 hypothetical protein BKA67DRAFT_81618 [Truncatella angustata]
MAPLTRRKAAQSSPQVSETAPPKSPAPKVKRKVTVEETFGQLKSPDAEETTPKRQRLAVRVRDEDGTTTTKIKRTTRAEPSSALKSKRSREALIADSAEESEDAEPTPGAVTKQLEEDARQQLNHELDAAAPKSKRIVFGDDDDVEKYVAAAAKEAKKAQPTAVQEPEDSDDDDEAPEAVTTSAAAKESKKAAQAATDAAEKQAATVKRKRQERDNMMKQQAQKRQRAAKPKKTSKAETEDEEDSEPEVERATTGRRRADKFNLPSVLPAEFLTDSEEESEDDRDLRVAKPKKIKFDDALQTLSQQGRAPRDEIVGSTAYRVMVDQSDQKLAPKANHNSKAVKEMLMHRRRVGAAPNKAKGFFKRT